jgi:3-hydroxyisobutyrate dehydrogenase-like beta-hydroxyacid dehydrogenase
MQVAFLGLGIMGSRMAANLVKAGHDVTAWTHTAGKAANWAQENGATSAETPAVAAAAGDVLISMLVDGPMVERVLLEAAPGARDQALFVDMSTIAPDESRAIAAQLKDHSIGFMDAPVTGSSPRAQDGTLTIMAGGEAADFERVQPLFEVMGELVLHVGELGKGELIKLINNSVAAANALALAQALVLADSAGADLDATVKIMANGSAASAMIDLKAAAMRDHDYAPLFKTEHMLKDVRLCLEEAQRNGTPFSTAALAREALAAACARGHGQADFASMIEPVEGAAGARIGD